MNTNWRKIFWRLGVRLPNRRNYRRMVWALWRSGALRKV